MNFTWVNGRQLATISKTGTNASYTYDVDGIRTSKTVNGDTTTYYLNGSQILAQENDEIRMDFIYDENGAPLGLDYTEDNETKRYYYVKNLEGDIVKIINNQGEEVVEYIYDGWGVPTVSGSLASTLRQDNPFRFKGYYYDVESGLYYLGNRYYDPIIGRFINADDVEILDGGTESLIENNLFVYCFNNPISLKDEDGNWPSWATKVIIGTAVIATAAILTVATAGTGTALACFAVGALKGATAGAAIGAVQGGATSAVVHRVQTGTWEGAGTAALNGAADGYMAGAITGFITGGLTSNACFVAGTVILTVAGKKAIEEIQVGDKVWAWDEKTGDVAVKKVVETYINESKELIHVFVEGEEIITTPTHLFYSPTRGWTEAIYVGDASVLVHNMCKITSPNQMQKQVANGQAPKEIIRVDNPKVPGQKPHVHFKDGTVHDAKNGIPQLSNKVRKWLEKNGWKGI